MVDEIWKDIAGFENYQISNMGRIKRMAPAYNSFIGKILRPVLHSDGYPRITLYCGNNKRTVRIHKLVLATFVGPKPDTKECRHLDGNPINNRLDNLTYGTHTENMQDKMRHGRHTQPDNRGERCGASKLINENIPVIRQLLQSGRNGNSGKIYTQAKIAKMFGVSSHAISEIKTGKTWRSIV